MKYLKPYWPGVLLIVLLLLGQARAELMLPNLMADIVNDGVVYAAEHGVYRTEFILRTGGIMLFFALLAGTASITAGYISPRIAAGVARTIRRDVFTKVESFSQAEFDKFSSASLITRCTNDVAQVQMLANIFARTLLYAPILGLGAIFMAVNRAVHMSWIIALAVIVLVGTVALVTVIVMPKFKLIQELVDKLNKVSREILHGLMVIRAFGTRGHEVKRFDKTNHDLASMSLFVGRVMAVTGPAITLVMGGTQVLVIWIGAHHVADSGLTIGDMMAFMQYSMQVIISFMMISFVMVMVPRAQVSAARIAEVLSTEVSIVDPATPQEFDKNNPGKGEVVFQDVCFKYPNAEANALDGISFTAKPGQTTAIIGATGAGKTTIAQLILRFYDVSEGKITVDCLNIKDVRQAELRRKIGYVPQKGQLLSGSIESNILYGKYATEGAVPAMPKKQWGGGEQRRGKPDEVSGSVGRNLAPTENSGEHYKQHRETPAAPQPTDETLLQAAKIAQAMEFIEEKDDKFLSEISQGGTNVSGGQRQRLSIARALAINPEIILFDDSFSALDFQTDANLRRALREHTAQATVIVIAQRVGTIMNAEEIIVLDKGKIVGRGNHQQLLETCPEYKEIAVSQNMANGQGEVQ